MTYNIPATEVEKEMAENTEANSEFHLQLEPTMQQIGEFPKDLPKEEYDRRMRVILYVFFCRGISVGSKRLLFQSKKN